MPQGLQTFDASGNLVVDTNNFLGRITYIVEIPASSSGSVSIPNPASQYGTPWGLLLPMSASFVPIPSAGDPGYPSLSTAGGTLTYSNPYAYAFKLIGGVF